MVDEQTKRAVESMALCGCEVDALCNMFPQISKDEIISICNCVAESRKNMKDDDTPNISCNCS